MFTATLQAVGAFVLFGIAGAILIMVLANILTSAYDKKQIGHVDESWYVFAGLVGILSGAVAATVSVVG